jgi:hypothetical protein
VTKFTLQLRGGKKSLLVNSRNLCKGTQRATVKLGAQNGRERSFRPVVGNGCKGAKPKGKGKGHLHPFARSQPCGRGRPQTLKFLQASVRTGGHVA